MLSVSTELILALVLGVAQLAAGVVVGLWLAGRRAKAGRSDHAEARRLAADLRRITGATAHSVRQHHDQLRHAHRRLRDVQDTHGDTCPGALNAGLPLTDLVAGVVREMLAANQKLARELDESHRQLEQQGTEMREHAVQALSDDLTGLPNRRAFDQQLRALMSEWRAGGAAFSLAMLDVDRFKQLNDSYGHPTGDVVLKCVADALHAALRSQDMVARYGGEEFAVLLPYTSQEDGVCAMTKALAEVAGATIDHDGQPLSVTASVGLATVDQGDDDAQLLRRADSALYAAKHAGRARGFLSTGDGCRPFDEVPPRPAAAPEPSDESLSETLEEVCREVRASLESLTLETARL